MDPFGIILFVEKEFEEEENEGGQEGDEKGTPGVKWGGHVTPLVLYHGWNQPGVEGVDRDLLGY